MSMKKKDGDFDIAGLLALKSFECPDSDRVEKNIHSTMRAVREANRRPSLHLFPDKRLAWMFAQPRYGVAALFILFLGLQLMRPTMPVDSVSFQTAQKPDLAQMDLSSVATESNSTVVIPPVPVRRQTDYSSLIKPVSLTK